MELNVLAKNHVLFWVTITTRVLDIRHQGLAVGEAGGSSWVDDGEGGFITETFPVSVVDVPSMSEGNDKYVQGISYPLSLHSWTTRDGYYRDPKSKFTTYRPSP